MRPSLPNSTDTLIKPTPNTSARIHTPQTAVTHYVSEFSLAAKHGDQRGAFETARNLVLKWAEEKRRMADFGIREEIFGGDLIAPEAWAMHLQHREFSPKNDYRRHWHIDVALTRRVSGFDVRVTVSHALDYSFVGWAPQPPDPSAPKFIYDWLAHENLALRSGQFPIAALTPVRPGGPTKLKERVGAFKVEPAQADILARLIFDPNRAMPVLLIHGETNPVTFPLNPHRLQQLMLGTCYVVWAPPAPGWNQAWTANFPKNFECRLNTVRLYQPGASPTTSGDSVRHRFFSDNEIHQHGGSVAFIAMIRDGLTRRLLAPKPNRIYGCEDVLALRANEDFTNQRSKLKSKDEELELYSAEHQRLLERNLISDQLLQETDADLQRTKSELEALRPHVSEMTSQLVAAKAAATPAITESSHSELLLRFFKNEAKIADQLKAISALYSKAVLILPSAIRSAEDSDQFEHLDQLRDLLLKLVCEYRDSLMTNDKRYDAWRVFGRNVFTGKESESLSRDGRVARTFEYNGEPIFMEQHLKIGVKESDARCLRLHFHWDATNKTIVIGHCGKHLPL